MKFIDSLITVDYTPTTEKVMSSGIIIPGEEPLTDVLELKVLDTGYKVKNVKVGDTILFKKYRLNVIDFDPKNIIYAVYEKDVVALCM